MPRRVLTPAGAANQVAEHSKPKPKPSKVDEAAEFDRDVMELLLPVVASRQPVSQCVERPASAPRKRPHESAPGDSASRRRVREPIRVGIPDHGFAFITSGSQRPDGFGSGSVLYNDEEAELCRLEGRGPYAFHAGSAPRGSPSLRQSLVPSLPQSLPLSLPPTLPTSPAKMDSSEDSSEDSSAEPELASTQVTTTTRSLIQSPPLRSLIQLRSLLSLAHSVARTSFAHCAHHLLTAVPHTCAHRQWDLPQPPCCPRSRFYLCFQSCPVQTRLKMIADV